MLGKSVKKNNSDKSRLSNIQVFCSFQTLSCIKFSDPISFSTTSFFSVVPLEVNFVASGFFWSLVSFLSSFHSDLSTLEKGSENR